MVKISVETDIELDIYPKRNLAVLKTQGQEISNYIFDHYDHDNLTVRFFGVDDKETSTVKCDVVRIW